MNAMNLLSLLRHARVISAVIAINMWLPAMAAELQLSREFIETPFTEAGQPVRLELLVHKPAGPGPFPTLIFNHGSTGRGDNPASFVTSYSSRTLSQFFVDMGWMVIYPQRRGRGASGGLYDEGFEPSRSGYSCLPNFSLPGVDRAVEDLKVVLQHVRQRPDVNSAKLMIGGQSRGGILAVAFAGEYPDTFRGVINFVGGWMGEGCPTSLYINGQVFKRGAKYPGETLWLYGERDPFYSIAHSRANFRAFQSAGGKGRFEVYTSPGQVSGHSVIGFPGLWSEVVKGYVDRQAP